MRQTRMLSRIAGLVWLCLASFGCGSAADPQSFVPNLETAQKALESVLQAQQAGESAFPVSGTKPAVYLVDSRQQQKPDQRLAGFEILGEIASDSPRCFVVRLSLTNPDAEVRERYVINGIDPLWVYRQEDYELLMHWEHAMPKPEDAATETQGDPQKDLTPSAAPSSEGK